MTIEHEVPTLEARIEISAPRERVWQAVGDVRRLAGLEAELTEAFMGGQETFTATMRAGMASTLEGIRASVESSGGSSEPVPRHLRS